MEILFYKNKPPLHLHWSISYLKLRHCLFNAPVCMYNIIIEDGQKENTNFTKPRILTYKSKGVKGVKWSHFLTTFSTMFRCQCVWKFKDYGKICWQKMQTCPLPAAPLLCLFDISASLLLSKIFPDLCIQI